MNRLVATPKSQTGTTDRKTEEVQQICSTTQKPRNNGKRI